MEGCKCPVQHRAPGSALRTLLAGCPTLTGKPPWTGGLSPPRERKLPWVARLKALLTGREDPPPCPTPSSESSYPPSSKKDKDPQSGV